MPTKEQHAWVFDFLGIDVDAVEGAVKATVHSLPGSAMLPDCKPVKGKVSGPPQHLLCAAHGHVVDIKEKKIIAISLNQYNAQKMGGAKSQQAALPGHEGPPAPPPPATAAPAPAPALAPPTGAASADAANAAKAAADVKKILNLMQLETEEIASIRAQHEDLAGGSRFNRSISWVSDTLGGADDPGDDLAEIGGAIAAEQMRGMVAVGSRDLDAAYKHLATMQALNHKARALWQKYTGDTAEGAERAVTGLEVVSKAGDVATMGLNVVAPGTGTILSVAKNVSVTGSKLVFGEKVNWTEFTIDMAFDLFVGGKGGQVNKAAEKLAGTLAKDLAPKLSGALVKRWGMAAVAKRLGGKVTEKAIEEYIVTEAEELIKSNLKDMVTPVVENVVEKAKGKDVTHEQLVDQISQSMTNPSGQLATRLSDKLVTDFKP